MGHNRLDDKQMMPHLHLQHRQLLQQQYPNSIYIYAQLALHNHSDISYMFMMTHKLSKCN